MYKYISLILVICFALSCTSDPYKTRDLGTRGNHFRNQYLNSAFLLHQDLYFSAEKLHQQAASFEKEPSAKQLNSIELTSKQITTFITKLHNYRFIHGPYDYPQKGETISKYQVIAAKHPDFSLSKSEGIEALITDKKATINENVLRKKHLLYSANEITIGIHAINTILKYRKTELLKKGSVYAQYLRASTKVLKDELSESLYDWSVYRSGNFHQLIKTRNYENFFSYLYTGSARRFDETIIPILNNQDQAIGYTQDDALAELNTFDKLWHIGKLEDFSKSLNAKTSAHISRLLSLLKESILAADKQLAENQIQELQELLLSYVSLINGSPNIQNQPYIRPHAKLRSLSQQNSSSTKDHIFGEDNNNNQAKQKSQTLQ